MLFLGDEVEEIPFEPMRSARNWLRKHFIIAYTGFEQPRGHALRGMGSLWSG
ncbi:MAG: hypothetical protein Ct9H300mP30_0970 [Methanobacteriota archaeon]|nr:MAG: hypothetical protein Ct9H300mP30_0970 [Euryarchaeota archaeon]